MRTGHGLRYQLRRSLSCGLQFLPYQIQFSLYVINQQIYCDICLEAMVKVDVFALDKSSQQSNKLEFPFNIWIVQYFDRGNDQLI